MIRSAVWLGSGRAPALSTADEKIELVEAKQRAAQAAKEKKSSPPPERTGQPQSQLPSLAAKAAATESPAASPLPPEPKLGLEVEVWGKQIFIRLGDRHHRIVGLEQNKTPGQLRVNVRCQRGEELFADTLDQMLGHSSLSTTQIYTQVSIQQLRKVHAATHPSARLGRCTAETDGQRGEEQSSEDKLLSLLAAEAAEAGEEDELDGV